MAALNRAAPNSARAERAGCGFGIHAEVAALRRLPHQRGFRGRRRLWVDLLVVSLRSGRLSESQPCFHCVQRLASWPGVRVRSVYYSAADGSIARTTVARLLAAREAGAVRVARGRR